MFKKILATIVYAGGIFFLIITKLFLMNLFPSIFTHIDIIMLFFVLCIMRGARGGIVWFAFFTYMILDMLTAHAFGIELIAGVLSVLGVYWFFEDVFTNLSIWTAGILTVFGMVVFRVLYMVLGVLFARIFDIYTFSISTGLLRDAGFEIMMTAILSVPLYAIVIKMANIWSKERIRYS